MAGRCVESAVNIDTFPTNVSYPRFAFQRSSRYGNRKALIDGVSGKSYTYAELWRNVRAFSRGLRRKEGFRKGQRMCIFAANCIDYAVVYYGVLSLGGVVVPLNPLFKQKELSYFIEDSEADFILTSIDFIPIVLQISQKYGRFKDILVFGESAEFTTFDSILRIGRNIINNDEEAKEVEEEEEQEEERWENKIDAVKDLAMLAYSSGTTGIPKGCMHTHYNFVVNVLQMGHPKISTMKEGEEVAIATMPMFHMFGMLEYFGRGFYQGVTFVVMTRFHLESYLRLIEKYKVTLLLVAPPIVAAVSQSSLTDRYDLSSLRRIINTASPLCESLMQNFFKKIPIPIIAEYGMTEILTCMNAVSESDALPGCMGRALPNVVIKVTDVNSGQNLGPREDGEICVKCPGVLIGYWKNDAAMKATFDDDGWFHTGDIGHYDNEGRFFYVNRIKDILKYNGFQVNPGELESTILLHPRVLDVGVIGKDDLISGHLPLAFVVVDENTEEHKKHQIRQEIIDLVKDKLAPHKRLRGGVCFVDAIPKSVIGKILRAELRRMMSAAATEELLGTGRKDEQRPTAISKL